MKDKINQTILLHWGSEFPHPGLDRIQSLCGHWGEPHKKYKTVLIAGTNGKGSTSIFLARILSRAGLKTGLFTSPHLENFSERIKVLKGQEEKEIDEQFALDTIKEVKGFCEKTKISPTYFEVATFLAFKFFEKERVDIAVLEVGMGGRLDSTNVVIPEVSVITNVGLDHSEFLGKNITSIAEEKAGIIRKGIPLVTGAKGRALKIIEEKTEALNSPLFVMGKDFRCKRSGNYLYVEGFKKEINGFTANYQCLNFSLALFTAHLLGIKINEKSIEDVPLKIPGRFDILNSNPLFIADGAHNPDAHKVLVKGIKKIKTGKNKNWLIIYSRKKGKSPLSLEILKNLSDEIWIVKMPEESRYEPLETIIKDAKKAGFKKIKGFQSIKEVPFEDFDKKRRNILLTGSLYLIGEFYDLKKSILNSH